MSRHSNGSWHELQRNMGWNVESLFVLHRKVVNILLRRKKVHNNACDLVKIIALYYDQFIFYVMT